jgi:hypothetical protein
MSRKIHLAASAVSILALSAVLASAQESRDRPGGDGKGSASERAAPSVPSTSGASGKSSGESAPARERGGAAKSSEGAGAGTSSDGARSGSSAQPRAQSQSEQKSPANTNGSKQGDAASKNATSKGDSRADDGKTPRKSAEPARQREDDTRRRADEPRRDTSKDAQRTAPKDQPARADTGRGNDRGDRAGTGSGTGTGTGSSGAGTGGTGTAGSGDAAAPRTGSAKDRAGREDRRTVSLTDEQRTVIRERIVEQRAPRANLKVDIRIGTTLPREVRLAPLPQVIVERVPAYRGYRYVLVEDEIVIVEPRTLRVVEVIERDGRATERRGSGTSAQRRALELSPDQERIVYQAVHGRVAPVDVRVRLGLGADIPSRVRLETFPVELVERIPDLRRYRFVVADRQVVVVEPDTREIVLLIDDR